MLTSHYTSPYRYKLLFPLLHRKSGQGGASECICLNSSLCGEVSRLPITHPRVFQGLSEKNKSILGADLKRIISKMEKVTSPSEVTVHVLLLSAFQVSSVRIKDCRDGKWPEDKYIYLQEEQLESRSP